MPKKQKFNFSDILMSAPDREDESVASVTKMGQLVIPRSTYTKYGLDGKAVKIVWDGEKKALGLMEIMVNFESSAWDKKTMRLLEANEKLGQLRVSVGRILSKVGASGQDYKKVPFGQYEDTFSDRPIYYVLLKNKTNEVVRHTEGVEATA